MATKKKVPAPPVYREFQFIVQAILLIEEEGEAPRPEIQQPMTLSGLKGLKQYIAEFPGALAQLNEASKGEQAQ